MYEQGEEGCTSVMPVLELAGRGGASGSMGHV